MNIRAVMYRGGRGTANDQPDYAQAILLLDRAVAQNNTEAMDMLADMYITVDHTAYVKSTYSSVMDLIIKALRTNPFLYTGKAKSVLMSLVNHGHVEAEYFLFTNLHKANSLSA